MMWHNKRPYQARTLLKSIRYWQSVANGDQPAKKPIAYYRNKLSYYTSRDIKYLENLSSALTEDNLLLLEEILKEEKSVVVYPEIADELITRLNPLEVHETLHGNTVTLKIEMP